MAKKAKRGKTVKRAAASDKLKPSRVLKPRRVLKGASISTSRLTFSADGAVLLALSDMLETHAWLVDSGQSAVGESLGDAMGDLTNLMLRSDASDAGNVMGAFAGALTAALAGKPPSSDEVGDALGDLADIELGGPKLTRAGEAYVKRIEGPTGVEPLDLASGRIRKPPRRPFRILSPDGQFYAAIHDGSNRIEFWDARAGMKVGTAAGKVHGATSPLVFSRDAKLLASEVGAGAAGVWTVPDGKLLRTCAGHTDALNAVAISPDGKYLATAADDHAVALWELPKGRLTAWLAGWKSPVMSLAFAENRGRTLLAACEPGSIGLFEAPTLQPLARALSDLVGKRDWDLGAVAASPDGNSIALAVASGTVHVFDIAALLAAGKAIKNDPVHLATPELDPKTGQPSEASQSKADVALQTQMRDRIAKARTPEFEREFKALFDALPNNTVRILFELDLTYGGGGGKEIGLYWAAQDKKGNTLVAYEFEPFKRVILPAREFADRKFDPVRTRLWDVQRDAVIDLVTDLWSKLAPAKLTGFLFVNFTFDNKLLDLRDRAWKDRGATL